MKVALARGSLETKNNKVIKTIEIQEPHSSLPLPQRRVCDVVICFQRSNFVLESRIDTTMTGTSETARTAQQVAIPVISDQAKRNHRLQRQASLRAASATQDHAQVVSLPMNRVCLDNSLSDGEPQAHPSSTCGRTIVFLEDAFSSGPHFNPANTSQPQPSFPLTPHPLEGGNEFLPAILADPC
jgi:hypothetical protein